MVPANDVRALFDWAERHALALFPIPAYCKKPTGIVRSHADDWSKDRAQWAAWHTASGGCNFGIECGASGIIVVDIDVAPDGRPYFDEFWAAHAATACADITPSGGWHVFTRVPEGIDAVALRQPDWLKGRVNVRAGRGYVVAPWCQTLTSVDSACKKDGAYRFASSILDIGPAPQELLDHCKPYDIPPAPLPTETIVLGEDGYPRDEIKKMIVEAKVAGMLDYLRAATANVDRNSRLNEVAFDVGRICKEGRLDVGVAEALLIAEGVGLGLDTKGARATTQSGLRKALTTPTIPLPKSALGAMRARGVPTQERAVPWLPAKDGPPGMPVAPVIERLLVEGCVTVLSGGSGTGKTTLGASLMAASAAGFRHFNAPEFGATHSDVMTRPACWIFVSYEGGQYMELHRQAWHIGMNAPEVFGDRRRIISRRGSLVYTNEKRAAVCDAKQVDELEKAIVEMRTAYSHLPLVIVVDNITSAVEDPMDQSQASLLMRTMRVVADQGIAVMLLAHPPKRGTSAIYGSHVFFSLADIVGELEALKQDSGEWTQWISFDKHRPAPNGLCLMLKSRRLLKPLMELPKGWDEGNERARQRALEDLRTPYIFEITVRRLTEYEHVKNGGKFSGDISAKKENIVPITGFRQSAPPGGEGAVILRYGPKPDGAPSI